MLINLLSIHMFPVAPKKWALQYAFGSVLGMLQSVSNSQQPFRIGNEETESQEG